MFPFIYSPTYEYPLSGDVRQDISPYFSMEIEGIPEVEYEVVTTVASYGKQLGKLTEAVLRLAEEIDAMDPKAGLATDEKIKAVREIAAGVEAAKRRVAVEVRERAEKAAARAEKLEGLGR